ncbi:MAG: porin [Pseudomonadota bacterium]
MKKHVLALAVIGSLAGTAHAQSALTIYGIVDAALVRERGGAAGNVTNLSSGVGAATRIGFRGTEDLGAGLSAHFVLETGARIDTGNADVPGSIFNRQAYVGFKHTRLGSLNLGRQLTPFYLTLIGVADPFSAGYAGTARNLFPSAGVYTRTSNTIMYISPLTAGFTAELSYALAEQPGDSTAGRQIGASLGYSNGPLNARLVYNHRNNDLTAAAGAAQVPPSPAVDRDIGRNVMLAANFDFKVAKAYAAYSYNEGSNSSPLPNAGNPYGGVRPTASNDSRDMLVGATIPFGPNTLMASYIRKDDKSLFNQDARQWAIGATHALSKRTSLYTAYAKISNKNGAGYTVGNNTDPGTGDSAFNLGVRHTF